MPFSSIALMSVASVYLGGGWVNFCSFESFTSAALSPSFRSGSGFLGASCSSSTVSSYTAV